MRSSFFSLIALPVMGLAMSLSIATLMVRPAFADVGLPVDEVVQALRRVRVPLLVPERLPFSGEDKIYWQTSTTPKGYSIEFVYKPDCQGTYCYLGSFKGEQDGSFDQSNDSEGVTLAKGKKAQYSLFRGAYYTAYLSWKERGVLYTVTIKNGTKEKVIQIANSAIENGFRD